MTQAKTRALTFVIAAACASATWLFAAGNAAAQDAAAFYSGKTLEMIVGYPPDGSNDLYARLVANNIGRHVPGAPRVITQNMPGAGSLVAANHLYNVAPKDGTILGAVSQGIPLQGRLGHPQARYAASKFNWLGRIAPSGNVTMVWHTSKAMSFDDALRQEVVLGATGAESTVALYLSVMNETLKTNLRHLRRTSSDVGDV